MNTTTLKLSVCMIAKNEESNLPRCLESVAGVADEIILVDTGSVDGTMRVAETFGARVVQAPWQHSFAAARNVSLSHAAGAWILVLDADEELEHSARSRLGALIETTEADGVQLIQRSLMPSDELCQYQDVRITRLFRNRPSYRYEQTIHEQIQPAILRSGGRIISSDLVITHYGYAQRTVQGTELRARRNLNLLLEAIKTAPADPYLHYQLGVTHKALGHAEQALAHLLYVLVLDPESLGVEILDVLYMKLAQLELGRDHYVEALHYAASSLRLNSENVVSCYVSALACLALGDADPAYAFLMQAYESANCSAAVRGEIDSILPYCRSLLGGYAKTGGG